VPDLSQAALVNDIMRDTWRPSVTIQAYATSLYRMAYYKNLMTFELIDNATSIQTFVVASIPTHAWGY